MREIDLAWGKTSPTVRSLVRSLTDFGVFVAVDRGAGGQVDDRGQGDPGVAEHLGELVEQHRADLFDPRDPAGPCAGPFERGLVEVDVHDRVVGAAVLRTTVAAGLGLVGQQRDDVLGVGQPAQGDRAELVAGGVWGQVGDQVAAGVQGVGDLVDGGVEPDAVGGCDRGDHGPQPVLVGRGDRDVAAAQTGRPLVAGGLVVGLDHLGLGDRQQPPRPLVDGLGRGPVDQRGRGRVQVTGHRRDLPDHPQVAVALAERGVELGQPVPQVQPVGDQRPDSVGVLAPGDRELAQGQVHHLRGPGATDPDQPRPTRRAGLSVVVGVMGVQVGPVQHQLQLTDLDRPPVPHRRLHRHQRLGSVEVLDGEKAGRLRHDSTQALATDSRSAREHAHPHGCDPGGSRSCKVDTVGDVLARLRENP